MMAAPAAAQGAPDAWAAYFPGEEYNAEDRRALLIEELVGKLASEQGRRLLQQVQAFQDGYVLPLDCDAMVACCDSEDLAAALELQPTEGLACIAAAAHEVGSTIAGRQDVQYFIVRGLGLVKMYLVAETCSMCCTSCLCVRQPL